MIALAIVAMLAMPASAMTQTPPIGEARAPPETTLDPGICRNFETIPGVCDELPKPTNPCNALLVVVSERCGGGGGGPGIGVPGVGVPGGECNDTETACVEASTSTWIVDYNLYCSGQFPCWGGTIAAQSWGPLTLGGITEVDGHLFGYPLYGIGAMSASDTVIGVHGEVGTHKCIEANALFSPNLGSSVSAYAYGNC